jgi:transcriptional regulator with XRE-family HTH domain
VPVSLYDPVYQKVRSFLKASRKNAGYTQNQLAVVLGVGQSYVSKIERAENFIDLVFFVKWCEACQSSPSLAISDIFNSGEA